jgi:hypothetical protein
MASAAKKAWVDPVDPSEREGFGVLTCLVLAMSVVLHFTSYSTLLLATHWTAVSFTRKDGSDVMV